jgi:hypothetical protein
MVNDPVHILFEIYVLQTLLLFLTSGDKFGCWLWFGDFLELVRILY